MLVDIVYSNKQVEFSYIENNKLIVKNKPFTPHKWSTTSSRTKYKNWDGKNAKKVKCSGKKLHFVTLLQSVCEENLFSIENPIVFYFDIVTNTSNKIVSLCAIYKNNLFVFCKKHNTKHIDLISNNTGLNYKKIVVKSEKDLIEKFIYRFFNKIPVAICAEEKIITNLRYICKKYNVQINFSHKLVCGYTKLIKKFEKRTLNNIFAELNIVGKINTNWKNINTSIFNILVLVEYEKNANLTNTLFAIVNTLHGPLKYAFSNIVLAETHLTKKYFDLGFVVSQNYPKSQKTTYKGAYTKQPLTGVFNNVMYLDFSSMFLNIIRQYNISPETFITNNKSKNVVETSDGTKYEKETSVYNKVLTKLINMRSETQAQIKILEQKIIQLKQHNDV